MLKGNITIKYVILLFSCLFLPCWDAVSEENVTAAEFLENNIVHNPTDITISEEELINLIKDYRIVFVGETHDNYQAHQVQLKIVKGLFDASGGNIVVGMEMFQRRSQEKLDAFISGKMDEKQFIKEAWLPDWGYDYDYYKEIFDFLKTNGIKLIALNANDELREKINKKGLENLSDEEKKELPQIDLTDEYHRKRIKSIYDVHGISTLDDFEKFYRIQCLWDETMADTAANYLKSSKGKRKQLIVLAGKGHIRYGFGIPKRLFRRLKASYCTILPIEIEIPESKKHNIMNVEDVQIPQLESDFFWLVGYSDPDSVKVRLGLIVMKSEKGVEVHTVAEASTAEIVGMKKGDVVVSVDGVVIEESYDLVYEMRKKTPGEKGEIVIQRDGEEMHLSIIYQAYKEEESPHPQ
ncbi:MAG: PDZ domain-containing protein [Planctomycetes bacterium]|nr:PDZ domain-containing protein [Planctomycetota bacterium]